MKISNFQATGGQKAWSKTPEAPISALFLPEVQVLLPIIFEQNRILKKVFTDGAVNRTKNKVANYNLQIAICKFA